MAKHTNPAGAIALTVAIDSVIDAGTVVEVTGEYTADQATADSICVLGTLLKTPTAADDKRAVETRFRRVDTGLCAETLAAGDPLKIGADGASGEQRFAKWATGSNEAVLLVGMALTGGDENEEIDIGFY